MKTLLIKGASLAVLSIPSSLSQPQELVMELGNDFFHQVDELIQMTYGEATATI